MAALPGQPAGAGEEIDQGGEGSPEAHEMGDGEEGDQGAEEHGLPGAGAAERPGRRSVRAVPLPASRDPADDGVGFGPARRHVASDASTPGIWAGAGPNAIAGRPCESGRRRPISDSGCSVFLFHEREERTMTTPIHVDHVEADVEAIAGRLEGLRAAGYFEEPRSVSDVWCRLTDGGMPTDLGALGHALNRLWRGGELDLTALCDGLLRYYDAGTAGPWPPAIRVSAEQLADEAGLAAPAIH